MSDPTRWRPIGDAPRQEEVLVCRAGLLGWWSLAWCTALGEWRTLGAFGGDPLPHVPTHWQPLDAVPRMRADAH